MQCSAEEPGECSVSVVSKSHTQLLVHKRQYFSANYASSLYSCMVIISLQRWGMLLIVILRRHGTYCHS